MISMYMNQNQCDVNLPFTLAFSAISLFRDGTGEFINIITSAVEDHLLQGSRVGYFFFGGGNKV